MKLSDSVTAIKGLGAKKALQLKKLEIGEIQDFLYQYPREYQDKRRIIKINETENEAFALVQGKVILKVQTGYRRKQMLRVLVEDATGAMEVLFFNGRFLMKELEHESRYTFYGKVSVENGKRKMIHPEFYRGMDFKTGIIPIYPLARGITQKDMAKWHTTALDLMIQAECEYLSKDIIERRNLCGYDYGMKNIHFPDGKNHLKAAKYRLIFDEFLLLQMGLLKMKNYMENHSEGIAFSSNKGNIDDFINTLPYELTKAQRRVAKEISDDMEKKKTMNRLVQGDVGSGKTVIAEIALYKAVKNGYQGVMMAPTELLAKQHFEGLTRDFRRFGIKVGFLGGNMGAKDRRKTLEEVQNGNIQILVGTHALIQPNVVFSNLGIVITDEQHRFGVNQRRSLAEKGENPDVLVMTATPIPRTLAVILYGDLDISIIDELPPNRQTIITKTSKFSERERIYGFVKKELEKGRQTYVVAPLISESESLENVRSAEEIYEELKREFSGFSVALLHGGMKQAEKDFIMNEFYENRIQMLVSTVVIEVGINVPNSTIMVVENAERFGLAQLHQLRGRIGRGQHQSYCLLISDCKTSVSKERIDIMVSTSDGFAIAEKDLELRGPGEFFGLRQHGIPNLKLGDLTKHISIFNEAKEEAKRIYAQDCKLQNLEYKKLKNRLEYFYKQQDAMGL